MTSISTLIANNKADLGFQRDLYEHLHRNPELSGQERETAARIATELERFDCEVTTNIGGFGLVAIFRNGEGPTVAMRADFDGLPVPEETGSEFASTRVQARADGSTTPVMHACGHDMHVTALLGVCATLDANRDDWAGTFVAVFQPSEENGVGADAMIADGLGKIIPKPDVYLGQHILPGRAGEVQSMVGGIMSGADSIRITIPGISAHGSMPHRSIDPTFIAAMVIVRLQAIVGREVDPDEFAVVTVGSVTAGVTNNIIPDHATLQLNCRYYKDHVRDTVRSSIERVVLAECQASGVTEEPTFEYFSHAEVTDNDPETFNTVRATFDEVFGPDSVTGPRSTGSEDFSHVPRALGVPYLFWVIGCTPREQWDKAEAAGTIDRDIPVNHKSTFLPDVAPTMSAATRAGIAAAYTYLAKD